VPPWKAVAAGAAALGAIGIAVLISRRELGSEAPKLIGRVALIGDSYAVGLGSELAKLLPDFQHEGRVGVGTATYKTPPWLAPFEPDIVLVSLGVNDGAAPNPANYQAIVRALHGIGAKVVWIEPPAGVRNDAVRQVIASLGVATVPATTTPLAADGLHPAGNGYSVWAREIAQVALA
jgi:hypothetical protein